MTTLHCMTLIALEISGVYYVGLYAPITKGCGKNGQTHYIEGGAHRIHVADLAVR